MIIVALLVTRLRSPSAAQSYEEHRAGQLKNKTLKTFPTI
jgi:hypothetical protein